eukprot:CAMPEP_0113935456 /NCGR_PEP_ID=MMETSP1339-20121228/2596_1 /TAXON_ID=94617 /ORGANISM="Fibrocapsa japonica" /LENGTH=254 /DNA_ID=CAMNT_0000937609 /DNA_START=192 /DNA_END=957 /DNA_ORIENTATION=- /assembly_acc=CAM_ASM_000762
MYYKVHKKMCSSINDIGHLTKPGQGFTEALHTASNDALGRATTLLAEAAAPEGTYSKASYYTTLGLYILSFPGLLSLVTRSTKADMKQVTYEVAGPKADSGARETKETAGQIVAYFRANNYKIEDTADIITFKGSVAASVSQAFFLGFVTFIALASLALVLQIQFQDIGEKWFLITLLSPYAGIYYWKNGSRVDEAKVKLEIDDDEKFIDVIVQAEKEELERFEKTLGFQRKGMVKVKGIFEADSPVAEPVESK